MDKSVEKTVTLFRKSYAGRLTADERAEMVRLLEDENMRRLYEEVGDDEYLIGEFRQYVGWEPVWGYRKFRKNMRRQSIRREPHSFVGGGQSAHGLRRRMAAGGAGQAGSLRENGGNRGGAGYLPGLSAIKQRRADCFGKIGTTGFAGNGREYPDRFG